jgi:hypothetical protein
VKYRLINELYTIAKKTAIGMAEMQDTNSKIMYKLVAITSSKTKNRKRN